MNSYDQHVQGCKTCNDFDNPPKSYTVPARCVEGQALFLGQGQESAVPTEPINEIEIVVEKEEGSAEEGAAIKKPWLED